MKKLFIGISGKMGTGKSTISHMLKAAFGDTGKVTISSLASPIYTAQHLLYNEYKLNLEGDKDRDLLLALGAWGRAKDPDFWLKQFFIKAMESDFDIVICDDVRMKNEADFFKANGVLVRIEGEQRGDNVDESKANNVTECDLDDYKFEHVISNKQEPALMCQAIAHIMMGEGAKDGEPELQKVL